MMEHELLKLTLAAREEGRDHAVITIASTSGSAPRKNGKLLVFVSGETHGTVGGGAVEQEAISHALACIRRGKGDYIEYDLAADLKMACGGKMALLTEVYRARPQLVICGAGHVGLALAAMARPAGFDVSLFDDRDPAVLPGELSPHDAFTQVESFEESLRGANIPAGAYFVIVTHGHACDAQALFPVLDKKAAYIGMIGSKNKLRAVYQDLVARGAPREALRAVYAPIGLDIGGETPEEIAVAILAEMIAVRYGKNGCHLKTPELVP